MQSKFSRVMCGTCTYWNGMREQTLDTPTKVVMLEEFGLCECSHSSKSGEMRTRDLKCKEYSNWIENLK